MSIVSHLHTPTFSPLKFIKSSYCVLSQVITNYPVLYSGHLERKLCSDLTLQVDFLPPEYVSMLFFLNASCMYNSTVPTNLYELVVGVVERHRTAIRDIYHDKVCRNRGVGFVKTSVDMCCKHICGLVRELTIKHGSMYCAKVVKGIEESSSKDCCKNELFHHVKVYYKLLRSFEQVGPRDLEYKLYRIIASSPGFPLAIYNLVTFHCKKRLSDDQVDLAHTDIRKRVLHMKPTHETSLYLQSQGGPWGVFR